MTFCMDHEQKRSWTKQCLKSAKLFLFFHLLAYIAAISSALKKSCANMDLSSSPVVIRSVSMNINLKI